MNWTKTLECGFDRFDTSNQCLLFVLRQVFAPGGECQGDAGCNDKCAPCTKVRALQTFVRRKFAFEERLMGSAGFPGLAEHAEDHRRFMAKLEARGQGRNCEHGLSQIKSVADLWVPLHLSEFDRSFAIWACGRSIVL